jgi:hypothetical protein
MERRDDRAGARATKQACKAGDEKTRAECRHMKCQAKQQGVAAASAGKFTVVGMLKKYSF